MKVVDWERTERGSQRKRENGKLLHCCCICGRLETWGDSWTAYYSMRELDDAVPIPKFCSEKCEKPGGIAAANVTQEMKRKAKNAEWRDPIVFYREATSREKYDAALRTQKT